MSKVFGDTSSQDFVEFVLFILFLYTMKEYSEPDFQNYLYEYLLINYPEKIDMRFIKQRNATALRIFYETLKTSNDFDRANEKAMDALMEGIQFSKVDFIHDILVEKYSEYYSRRSLYNLSKTFIDQCEPIFGKYTLSDDFIFSRQAKSLRKELLPIIETIVHNLTKTEQ